MNAPAPARLALVIHNHQPTGNFDHVFALATDKSYEPFVGALEQHPHVKVALHYTGPLLEWLERHRPELIARIRLLVERGQAEVVGGGWAEPMLSVLPDRDALGQIRTMRLECARLFGRAPRGMWLAERVWDPDLPRILHEAGVEWVLLDDTHFRFAGVPHEWVTGAYRTEKAGAPVAVLPIAKQLRYALPFRLAHEAVDLIASRRGEFLTYGDDGEKFGLWPDTDLWVWKKGWLRDFFRLLGERSHDVVTVHPSEVADAPEADRGRIYLPTASYHEMGEWSLPVEAGLRAIDLKHRLESQGLWDQAAPFVRGGIWQNFLGKYPESNRLHKRMIRVSRKVRDAVRLDPLYPHAVGPATDRARLELYRGQCNCPYWHGLFGGLYLPHLRSAVHSHLIRADRWVDPCPTPRLSREDWDLDGQPEVFLETASLAVAVKPHLSGALELIDLRSRAVDLVDVMARRPEIYHAEVPGAVERWKHAVHQAGGEGGIASIHDRPRRAETRLLDLLRYDRLPRLAFLDRLLPPDASFDDWQADRPLGGLDPEAFVHSVEQADAERPTTVGLRARLPSPWGPLELEKWITVDPDSPALEVRWTLHPGDATQARDLRFGTELTLLLPEHPGTPRGFAFDDPAVDLPEAERALESRGALDGIRALRLQARHHGFDVALAPQPAATLWRRPIETVSQSEEGFESVFQGSHLAFLWPLHLEPHRPTSFALRLTVRER